MNWNGLSGIDLGSIEEDTGSSTLSAGAHICRISDAELNKTKNGKGHRLAITLQSLDGGGQVIDYFKWGFTLFKVKTGMMQKESAEKVAVSHASATLTLLQVNRSLLLAPQLLALPALLILAILMIKFRFRT